MCSPALASLGASSFGVGMSSVGALFQASSQRSALRSQARIAEINARLSDEAGRNAVAAGNTQESRIRLAGEQAKATQTATMASRGIDIANSNTALARLTGTDLITDVDANTVRANALREAWGHRIDASNQRAGARSARATASSISPGMAFATSLVSGAGQVAASWYEFDRAGAFDRGGNTGGFDAGRAQADAYRSVDEIGNLPWFASEDVQVTRTPRDYSLRPQVTVGW